MLSVNDQRYICIQLWMFLYQQQKDTHQCCVTVGREPVDCQWRGQSQYKMEDEGWGSQEQASSINTSVSVVHSSPCSLSLYVVSRMNCLLTNWKTETRWPPSQTSRVIRTEIEGSCSVGTKRKKSSRNQWTWEVLSEFNLSDKKHSF